jgi:hypothetical protein
VTPEPDDPTAPYRQAGGPPWVIDIDIDIDASQDGDDPEEKEL